MILLTGLIILFGVNYIKQKTNRKPYNSANLANFNFIVGTILFIDAFIETVLIIGFVQNNFSNFIDWLILNLEKFV